MWFFGWALPTSTVLLVGGVVGASIRGVAGWRCSHAFKRRWIPGGLHRNPLRRRLFFPLLLVVVRLFGCPLLSTRVGGLSRFRLYPTRPFLLTQAKTRSQPIGKCPPPSRRRCSRPPLALVVVRVVVQVPMVVLVVVLAVAAAAAAAAAIALPLPQLLLHSRRCVNERSKARFRPACAASSGGWVSYYLRAGARVWALQPIDGFPYTVPSPPTTPRRTHPQIFFGILPDSLRPHSADAVGVAMAMLRRSRDEFQQLRRLYILDSPSEVAARTTTTTTTTTQPDDLARLNPLSLEESVRGV